MKNIIVIKIGGRALTKESLRKKLLKNIITTAKRYSVIVVHGGQSQISNALKRHRIKTKFVRGQRYTDTKTLKIVADVLTKINKKIVCEINSLKGQAVGLSGADSRMIVARRINSLGYVGKVEESVNTKLLKLLLSKKCIPVIFSICARHTKIDGISSVLARRTRQGETILNVNADAVASAVACALKVHRLIFISDVPGILNRDGKIISTIKTNEIQTLKKQKVITKGMIPKIDGCFKAIKKGVKEIYITNNISSFCSGTNIKKF